MSDKLKSYAMLEVAEHILKDHKEPMTIQQLLSAVAEIKEIPKDDVDRLTQLYMDITQSAKFVYCGEDQWDLKERNLELWDKDGHAFASLVEIEEEIEEEEDEEEEEVVEEVEEEEAQKPTKDDTDDDDEPEAEEEDEEVREAKEYIEAPLPIKSTDDDDDDDDIDIEFDSADYDEDDYNEIMDDYEDMYEDD
ncbi:MAG: DNA-directed RNA polymerase subunit delta [Acholeplasmataceae bacterium]|nr:MAG: DNA-directed RNA polymerase subunit delta [Acholeplasmataceae bacterium]